MITERLAELVRSALDAAVADGVLSPHSVDGIEFERPRKREHGDWATNIALSLGQGNPRATAQAILDRLPESDLIERVDVAGPGFLNFHLSASWLHDVVRRAADASVSFGKNPTQTGEKINVEYVSANPTGPMSVVSGRHAAVGDAIANLLEAVGCDVTREFYVNDYGRQAVLFGKSVAARYLQHFGVEAELPEDGYRGDYVSDVARAIADQVGDEYVHGAEHDREATMTELALAQMVAEMKASLERFGSRYDVWFSEKTLHDADTVAAAVEKLQQRGLVIERDGALWFCSSQLGDDKDRVMIRANGEPTYLASDAAYLLDKFGRGFDRLIFLWGADHHGYIARQLGAAEALGYDRSRVEISIVQVVTLSHGVESLKGSKRAGVVFELDALVDEVGADACRFMFLTRSIDAPLDFDIALAKEQAPENPVYYVQYAHARICSILRRADDERIAADPRSARLDRLGHPSEDQLMRKLASYEEVVPEAAEQRAPQKMTRYVHELASDFTAFYRDCRVVSEDPELTNARLALCVATKRVLADGLGLLVVNAPERM